MYKLSFRNRIWFGAAIVIAIGLIFGLGGAHSPWSDDTTAIPLQALVPFELFISLFFARVCFDQARLDQIGKVAAAILLCILSIACIGTLVGTGTTITPAGKLLITWVNFGVSNAFGVAAIIALLKLEPRSVYIAGTGEETDSPEAIAAAESAAKALGLGTHKASAATSSTKLRGILDKLDAESQDRPPEPSHFEPEPEPEPAQQAVAAAQQPAAAAEAAQAQEAQAPHAEQQEQKKSAASATATRLQAQKRRSTSTFTKLQALSASAKSPLQKSEETLGEGTDLKDILERLDEEPLTIDEPLTAPVSESLGQETSFAPPDTEAPSAPAAAQAPSAPAAAQAPSAPAAAQAPSAPAAAQAPSAPPQPAKGAAGLGARLIGAITGNKLPAAQSPDSLTASSADVSEAAPGSQQPITEEATEEQSVETSSPGTAAAPTPAAPPAESAEAETEKGLFDEKLDEEVDDIFSKLVPAEAQKDVADRGAAEAAAATVSQEAEQEALDALDAQAAEEAESKLFGQGVDKDVDDIFSQLVPPEAQMDVGARRETADSVAAGTEANAEAMPQMEAAPAAQEPSLEAMEEERGLFDSGLDRDVDDIFSQLVPPEAQKDVADARYSQPAAPEPVVEAAQPAESAPEPAPAVEPPPAPVAESTDSGGLFEKSVDSDIDDIFSTLAPEEAMREVAPSQAQPQATSPETISFAPPAGTETAAPQPEVEQQGLFNQGLESDLDDIFSNLAPEEAQRNVSSDTLRDVKAEPAPQGTPEQSFAPPEGTHGQTRLPQATADLDTVSPQEILDEEVLRRARTKETGMFNAPPGMFAKTEPGQKAPAQEPAPTAPAPAPPAPAPAPPAPAPAPPAPAPPAPAPAPPAPAPPAPAPASSAPAAQDQAQASSPGAPAKQTGELKEFGRLSSRSAAEPKATADSVGTMKTIGKLLLDVQVVENIIKAEQEATPIGANLSTARIISSQRGEGIKALLTQIDQYPTVSGSLIVGHDGLVIAATTSPSMMDKDVLGALSTALLSTSNLATKKLEIGKLRQMVLFTTINGTEKLTVLTDVDVGILAVFCEQHVPDRLDGLIEAIHSTIHG